MSDPIKVTINGEEKEVYLKDDFVAVQSKAEKLERDLEDTRMEVLTPEYDAFLKTLDKESKGGEKKEEKKEVNDDEFKNLTPKQIYERAKADVLKEVDEKISSREKETKADQDARVQREVASFAKTHDDYEKFRPIMYGMSLDPKNADLTIAELYDKAKEHVKSIQSGATEKEKEKSRKIGNERPGNSSESFAKLKATSNEKLAQEAFDEVSAELGPIPPA